MLHGLHFAIFSLIPNFLNMHIYVTNSVVIVIPEIQTLVLILYVVCKWKPSCVATKIVPIV